MNVIPLYIAKKINAKWDKKDAQIIRLDKTHVHAIAELIDVIIQLSSDGRVHQCFNIVIMYMLEAYGVLLSRDWSNKIQGYFAMDWSHLWIPYKGKNNKIWVDWKIYMKHNVTPLNRQNEPMAFAELIFGNCFLETQLGCYLAQPSLVQPDTQLDLLPSPTGENDHCRVSSNNNSTSVVPSPCTYDMCTLYFDGSKMQEGSGDGCVLIDPL